MEKQTIRDILERVADGGMSVDDAVLKLKMKPFEDIGFAKL
ncbi:MAG: 1-(5-phosphoribosyl)-5-amino-4-imidazole-carboxylate carboxylase, partial [Clostridia bacterium]|nr:1-(5-phosphoribosyl)-5-amino-4-imidazole-carboxylate carboxylase [Clostridia bacterium]